jgi:putative methionine-R-sulfoxide reductase with GAF domain
VWRLRQPLSKKRRWITAGPIQNSPPSVRLWFDFANVHFHQASRVFSVNCSEEQANVFYEVAMTRVHEELLREFQEWSRTAATPKALMERITQRLHEKMTKYNWVGFYLVDPVDSGFLVVGPFVGSFTPNAQQP